MLSHGLGYEWPSRIGALLAVGGVAIAVVSALLVRRESGADAQRPTVVAGGAE